MNGVPALSETSQSTIVSPVSIPDPTPAYARLGEGELLSDKAYRLIRAAIVDGTQPPGSRLVESDIARRMGVSQAPIREAVKRLALEGLVTSIPRRGSYVTEIMKGEAATAREIRASVERAAAEFIANSSPSERQLPELREIVARMQEFAEVDDIGRLRDADLAFHRTLTERSGSAVLTRVWSVLEPIIVSQRVIGDPGFHGGWMAVVEDHGKLVELLEHGAPEEAVTAVYEHAMGRRDLAGPPTAEESAEAGAGE